VCRPAGAPVASGSTVPVVGGEPEDFDVEAWNQRFLESPSGPVDRPRVRTRRLDPPEEPAAAIPGPVDDLFGDPLTGTEAVVEEGFPAFEHNQWTVEGEIERFGAFGRGVSASQGWKRGVALGLLVLLLLPLLLEAAQIVSRVLS
jgi:hypothetical protein